MEEGSDGWLGIGNQGSPVSAVPERFQSPRFSVPSPTTYGYPVNGFNSSQWKTRGRGRGRSFPRARNNANKGNRPAWNKYVNPPSISSGSPGPFFESSGSLENSSSALFNEGPWGRVNGRSQSEKPEERVSKCTPNIGGYSPNMPFHPSKTGICGIVGAVAAASLNVPRIHPPLEGPPAPPVFQPIMNNIVPEFAPRPQFPPSQLIGVPLCYSQPPPVFSPTMTMPQIPAMMQIPGFPFTFPPAAVGLDPYLAERASSWSVHVSPDGKNYYYNVMSQISTWDKPEELIEFEKNRNAAFKPAEPQPEPVPKPVLEPVIQQSQAKKQKTCKKEDAKIAKEKKPKPIASRFIPGSVWCLVKTSDNRIFFYNACKKISEWEVPPELTHKPEIYQMIEDMKKEDTGSGQTKENSQNNPVPAKNENKRIESPSLDKFIGVGISDSPEKNQDNGQVEKIQTNSKTEIIQKKGETLNDQTNGEAEISQAMCETSNNQTKAETDNPKSLRRQHLKEENGMIEEGSPNAAKKPCLEGHIQNIEDNDDSKVEPTTEFTSLDEIKSLKGVDIEIVEQLAAKERATTSFEIRSQKFQELLKDKNISAFSTWQRELPKIIYDPRYLLLTFKERKSAFETYVKARANDEMKENQTRLKTAKQEFCNFVESVLDGDEDLSYDKFERKYAKDSRLNLIEKPIDRKRLFMKFSGQRQQKAKKELEKRRDDEKLMKKLARKEAKKGFKAFLDKKITSYHYIWKNVWKDFDLWTDRRYLQLDECEMQEMFEKHCQKLKRKAKESKEEKHSKRRKKEKIKEGKDHSRTLNSSPSPQRTGASSDKNMSEGEISTDSA